MRATAKAKPRPDKPDPAAWMPRREAAQLLKVSLPTILSWAGPRFRVTQVKTKARIKWFVYAEDVERVRLQRIGPTAHELESFVLTELAAGRSASEIVCSGHQVTLGDVERIRDLEAKLSGGFVVDAATTIELRHLFNVEAMSGPLLIAHVRALRQRVDLLIARRNDAAMARRATQAEESRRTEVDGDSLPR